MSGTSTPLRPLRERRPLSGGRELALAWSKRHPLLLSAASGALTVALVLVIAWFLLFSGLNGPVQFVYAAF